MKKVFLIFITVLFSASVANAAKCASEREVASLNVQALKSQLMVSALSCGKRDKYNAFMKKFKKHIYNHHKQTAEYFDRSYMGSGEKQLNGFITSLANKSSKQSLTVDVDKFCGSFSVLFDKLLDANHAKLVKIASRQKFSSMHGIDSCGIRLANQKKN